MDTPTPDTIQTNKSLLSHIPDAHAATHPIFATLTDSFSVVFALRSFLSFLSFFSSIWAIPTHLSSSFLTLSSLLPRSHSSPYPDGSVSVSDPSPLNSSPPSIVRWKPWFFIYCPHATPHLSFCSCEVRSFLRSSTLDSGVHPHIHVPFHPQDGILLLPFLPIQNRNLHLILPRMGHCCLAHPLSKSHVLCLSSGDSAHLRHPHLLRRRRRAHRGRHTNCSPCFVCEPRHQPPPGRICFSRS